ncbi:MAG: radical SAM protein [Planctomycetota bacterium]
MLRVALLSPKGPLYRHRGGIFKKSLRYAPLTMTTLAALIPDDVEVELTLIDEGIEPIPEKLEADLVGMTVITGTAPRAYELSARFRERGMPVVLGGPHVTLVPEDAAPHADSIVVGYAEESWPELLRDRAAGRMRARYDQRDGLDLAGTPAPRRDLLPRGHYLTNSVFEATRGCVHDCDFCVVPSAWGRRPLQKPVADVLADVEAHLARTGDRRLIFVDLNLIADRPYARALFRALAEVRVEWYGLATTLLADDADLLGLAEASGCRGLLIGFESIVPGNVASSNKAFNRPDGYARVVERLHAHGIAVYGCFVFGMDEDTPEVFEETARFTVEAGIDLPRFAIQTPFPGTPLFRRLNDEGRILTRNWELYDGQHVVFEPARMSAQQLQEGTEHAWKSAYSVRSMWTRLRRSPAPLRVALASNLGYRYYAHRLHRYYNCDWILRGAGAETRRAG